MKVKTLGIDLAKETFGLHGVDSRGREVVHKRVTRKHLLGFLVKVEPCLSFRLKEKLKAGLLKSKLEPPRAS